MGFTEIEEEILTKEDIIGTYALVLYNDDYNTFDFVIETLMELCGHTAEQAEQSAVFVHYKGKCAVKNGTYNALKPICLTMLERGLSAKIEN